MVLRHPQPLKVLSTLDIRWGHTTVRMRKYRPIMRRMRLFTLPRDWHSRRWKPSTSCAIARTYRTMPPPPPAPRNANRSPQPAGATVRWGDSRKHNHGNDICFDCFEVGHRRPDFPTHDPCMTRTFGGRLRRTTTPWIRRRRIGFIKLTVHRRLHSPQTTLRTKRSIKDNHVRTKILDAQVHQLCSKGHRARWRFTRTIVTVRKTDAGSSVARPK